MERTWERLRQTWSSSRPFRTILTLALVYGGLRLLVHGGYLTMMLYPHAEMLPNMPEWTGADGQPMVPVDLQVYLDAARDFVGRDDLYLQGDVTRLEDLYQYAPAFALAFVPFLRMAPVSLTVVHTLLHIAAYVGLYLTWDQLFHDMGLKSAGRTLGALLPLWVVYSAFWTDLSYLNIYVVMALLSTFLIRAVLREDLVWSVFWTSLILQIKPQWAFAVAIPLLLGRHRFFLRLMGWSALAYGAVVVSTMMLAGPSYVGRQYGEYVRFLQTLPGRFPWRGPEAAYLGYNHSVKQIIVYLTGDSPAALRLATVAKVLLLVPLVLVSGRYLIGTLGGSRIDAPGRGIDLAFALYLGAFIWLDMVWELTLGIAAFGYLLATLGRQVTKGLLWASFVPYAMVDVWRLVSLGAFGPDVIAPGPYVLTDPSMYVPVVMIAILFFYAILLRRLWITAPTRWEPGAC